MAQRELITRDVRSRLGRLRRAIRAHLLGEGLAWLLLALAALVVVTLLFDWGLHRLTHQPVGRALRGVILLAALAGVAYVGWRRLLRPLLAPLRPDDLALLVEKRYPQLDDRLISAVQFSRQRWEDPSLQSPALVRRMAEQANAAAGGLDFLAPLNRRRLWGRLGLGGFGLLVLAVLTLAAPDTMALWFRRNVLFQDTPWPQQTHLLVRGGPEFTVVRGEDFEAVVEAGPGSRVVPPTVRFLVQYESVAGVEESTADRQPDGTYRRVFQNVREPFTFHVAGNDGRTPTCRVNLVEPPDLADVRFTIRYPAYMNLPPREIAGGRGVLSIPPGADVDVRATATKPLGAVRLLLDGEPVGQAHPSNELRLDRDAPAAPGGLEGQFRLVPRRAQQPSATLRVELTDREGHVNRRAGSFAIHLAWDQPPDLTLTWLGSTRKITPRAVLRMEVDARDDYGVASLSPLLAVKRLSREPMPVETRAIEPASRHAQLRYDVDLQALDLGLQVGEVLQVLIQAADAMPPDAGGPNVRRSEVREFQIVSDRELLDELLRQQQEMSVRMQDAMRAQAAARDRMLAARDQLRDPAGAVAEAQRLIAVSLQEQQSAASLASSILDVYRDIVTVMENNRVGQEDLPGIRANIVDPLAVLTADPMTALVADLRAAREGIGAGLSAEMLDGVAGRQQQRYDEMMAIFQQMAKVESIAQLAKLLRDIIDVSDNEVRRGIEQRLRERTEQLLGPQPGPATTPATEPAGPPRP